MTDDADQAPGQPGHRDTDPEAERIFLEAQGWPMESREARLEAACAGDAELLARVRARFRDAGRADDFLARLEARLPLSPLGAAPSPPEAPERIGPWRLTRVLGRGGMGTVFLGERVDGAFEQRVAVKLLPPAWASDLGLERFERERRILGSLEHPNVARLLDGGVTPGGFPYLAMEYVEGEPIDRYCDSARLSVEARLALFDQVLDAVGFSHANLVIHRDLKPSNILVDAHGRVKLLDFGIAKLLTEESPGIPSPSLTRTGSRILTPAHASPEQILGEPVTTASDVYALGILLHLLLVGRHPFRKDDATPGELEREILTGDPPLPSRHALAAREAAAGRGMTPARLQRRLRGDLDTVLHKAMQREADRRYPSVDALREDLRRHRSGLPIRARGDRWIYRAGKFVRRHRWGVGTSAAAAVAVVGGLLAHAERLEAERDVARQAQGLAEREARKAGEVVAFLSSLFEGVDPAATRGEEVTALMLLDRGSERLDALEEEPLVLAELAGVLGGVNHELGRYEEAERLRRRAVEILETEEDGAADVPGALSRLGLTLAAVARFEEAEAAQRSAVAAAAASGDSVRLASFLHNLSSVLGSRGNLEEAEAAALQGLELRRRLPGIPPEELASSLHGLGITQNRLGRYREAEESFQEAFEIRSRELGPDHPVTLFSLGGLAAMRSNLGDLEGAEAAYSEVLAARRRILGPDHPDVAVTAAQLGLVHWRAGDPDRAERYWEEARDIRIAALGPDHPDVAGTMNNLAAVARERGDLASAEAILRETLRIYQVAHGPAHPLVAEGRNNLAATLADLGRLAEAETLYREALAMRRDLLGNAHDLTAGTAYNLGRLLTVSSRWEEAEALVSEALAIRAASLGEEHATTMATATTLERIRERRGASPD